MSFSSHLDYQLITFKCNKTPTLAGTASTSKNSRVDQIYSEFKEEVMSNMELSIS